jgi:hypothetical protein
MEHLDDISKEAHSILCRRPHDDDISTLAEHTYKLSAIVAGIFDALNDVTHKETK